MRIINKTELTEILAKHLKWWRGESGGERANLCDADLRDADLCDANLRGANLRGADLRGADLCDANLRGADLRGADLCDADLRGADLCDADLRGADLRGAKNVDKLVWSMYTAFYPIQCPETGSFVAYKKAHNRIVVLEVCEDAMRSSATSRKCRCSKAKVLRIENPDGSLSERTEIASDHDPKFIYKVGETVEVMNFEKNRWVECAPGIHFFITRDEAVEYF